MTNGTVTNKDLYESIDKLRTEIVHRIERVEYKVDENTGWRNKIVGQFTFIMVFVGAAVNWLFDKFSSK